MASVQIAELRALANIVEDLDYYQLLEVPPRATVVEVRAAYHSLARRFHPDHFHRPAVRDLQPELEKLFARMTEAYQALSDEGSRRDYDHGRRKTHGDDRAVQQKAAKEVARDNFRAARAMLDKGQFVKALPYLENAVKADGTEARYLEALGSVQSLNPRHKTEAETNLKKAAGKAKSDARGYLMLGLPYARYQRFDEARTYLKEALSWDSSCEPARVVLPALDAGGKEVAEAATQMIRRLLRASDASAEGGV